MSLRRRKARLRRTRPSRMKRKARNDNRAIRRHSRGFVSTRRAKVAWKRRKTNRAKRLAARNEEE